MLRTKMTLLTVVVVALAVPSLWAQKERLVRPKPAPNGAAVCTATLAGVLPAGYYAETNKCSSGNSLQDPPAGSAKGFATTCADMGGVEAKYDQPISVEATPKTNGWPNWTGAPFVDAVESNNPPVYRNAIGIEDEIGLTLTNKQGILGLEVDNLHQHLYSVVFHTTGGDVSSGPQLVGGQRTPFPFAQRFIAICSGPVITGVTATCNDCTELHGLGDTAVSQIRGDKFKGF
jgi:hypothetical protein